MNDTLPPRATSPLAARMAHTGTGALNKRLLVVDDEESIRLALSKFLRSRGYEVQTADSGAAALELLERYSFMLMLCDIRMPGMTGIEVIGHAAKKDPDLAILMLTAVNDAPTATEALSSGACDYLMKPVELSDLHQAVERALHRRDLTIEQRHVERMIREEVSLQTAEIEQEKQALRTLTVSIAETLINAMEAKDVYLRGHSQRVSEFASSIGEELGLGEDTVEAIRLAGRLHDVGLIGIREEVLNKPGQLTPEEFAHVKTHVRISMDILAPLKHLGIVLDFVHDHHERVDGSGYPRGLRGSAAISIGGRVLAAADAYDALTSRRAYRAPRMPDDTLQYLETYVNTLLDEDVYNALCSVVRRRKSLVFIED